MDSLCWGLAKELPIESPVPSKGSMGSLLPVIFPRCRSLLSQSAERQGGSWKRVRQPSAVPTGCCPRLLSWCKFRTFCLLGVGRLEGYFPLFSTIYFPLKWTSFRVYVCWRTINLVNSWVCWGCNTKKKISRQEAPNSVGGGQKDTAILVVMMMMTMMMILGGCRGRGGRCWCWGGWDDEVDVEDEEEDDVEEENRSQDREAHFVRACAVEMHMDMLQEPFCVEIYRKNGRGRLRGHRFFASLRTRNAHGHVNVTRAILYWNLQEKWTGTPPGTSFCASLRSRNAHGHLRRAILFFNFTGKMPNAFENTSIKHRALSLTARTPQCGHTVWNYS